MITDPSALIALALCIGILGLVVLILPLLILFWSQMEPQIAGLISGDEASADDEYGSQAVLPQLMKSFGNLAGQGGSGAKAKPKPRRKATTTSRSKATARTKATAKPKPKSAPKTASKPKTTPKTKSKTGSTPKSKSAGASKPKSRTAGAAKAKAAHAGGCHTMVVAVPIPDYVEAEDEKDDEKVIK